VPPFSLDIRDAITVITGIVTIAGVIFSLRAATGQLKVGQTEVLRQLGAIHKRLDGYGQRIGKAEINHAVLLERVENLRDTQRMRRARLEATESGEVPMFTESEEG
jgi:hypothetical protein